MRLRPQSRFLPVALAAIAVGCSSGATGGGCSGTVEPIPEGFTGEKLPNAAVVRISGDGFSYLNQNWTTLVAQMMPGAQPKPGKPEHVEIPFMMPCTQIPKPFIGVGGDIYACDNGRGGQGTVGFMDGQCTADDAPCPILLTLEDIKLLPASPNMLNVKATVSIDALRDPVTRKTSDIYFDSAGKAGACVLTKRLGCSAGFYSSRGDRPNEQLTTSIEFGLDTRFGKLLTFDVAGGIGGIDDLESKDLAVDGCNRLKPDGTTEDMCEYACTAIDWGFVKGLIVDMAIKPQLEKGIQGAIAKQRCRPCDGADPLVPQCPATTACGCMPGASDCVAGAGVCLPTCSRDADCGTGVKCVCRDGAASCSAAQKVCENAAACAPRLLGMEHYLNAGSLLSDFGADPSSRLELYAAAGGEGGLKVGAGFQVGMVGGAKAIEPAACVLDQPAPVASAPGVPDLQAQGPAGHHVGIALSEQFLNRAFYEAHRSGALCLNVTTAQAAPMTTGMVKTFLPSLGVLAGGGEGDSPMMVVLRPLAAPQLRLGAGTYDPGTRKPIDPLLTLDMSDVRIDLYAFIDGRYSRLFTLGADIKLPLSIIAEGCPLTLTPALGDLTQLVVIRKEVPNNSELLAEDPAALVQLIPMVLSLAEPMVASILKPMAIPDMNGFRVNLDKLQGLRSSGATGPFTFLGAFGRLGLAGGQCESWGPKTVARLVGSRMPERDALRLDPSQPLPWPVALIAVEAVDLPGQARPMEFAWRLDGGMWTNWFEGPQLEVTHPSLLVQGRHVIEVRSRIAGDPGRVDPNPQRVTFLVDFEAPEIEFAADRMNGRLEVKARDNVTEVEGLRFAYRVGDAALSAFGEARAVDLEAVEQAGGLEVQVRDEFGNVASAVWRPTPDGARASDLTDLGPEDEMAAGAAQAMGCSAAGAGALGSLITLGIAPLALLRRRRQVR